MTREEYNNFLAEIRKLTKLDMLVPDEDGLVTFSVDDTYNVSLQYISTTEKILCFVEVTTLPKTASKEVYRDLLVGGLFGKETAGGYFSIEEETNTVVYNYFFDGDKVLTEPEQFVSALENIMQLCDMWKSRITEKMMSNDSEKTLPPTFQHHNLFA